MVSVKYLIMFYIIRLKIPSEMFFGNMCMQIKKKDADYDGRTMTAVEDTAVLQRVKQSCKSN